MRRQACKRDGAHIVQDSSTVRYWLVVCCMQEGRYVRPGWVKMRYTADGVTVAWHPAVHQLSLPVAVAAAPSGPLEPVGEAARHFAWHSTDSLATADALTC